MSVHKKHRFSTYIFILSAALLIYPKKKTQRGQHLHIRRDCAGTKAKGGLLGRTKRRSQIRRHADFKYRSCQNPNHIPFDFVLFHWPIYFVFHFPKKFYPNQFRATAFCANMRQTIGTYLRNDSIPSSLNEDEIRRRLGIDDLLCTNNKSVENVHSYRSLFLPSLPSTSVIFVLAALVNFATVGMAAPMHKAILMRKSLSDIDLSSLEDTILPDTDRHRFATVSHLIFDLTIQFIFFRNISLILVI